MKTYMPNQQKLESERRWFVIDVKDKVLGRQATQIASILRGKHKAEYTPYLDCGDFVVVINADKIRYTGRKREKKIYYSYTGYLGGLKQITADKLMETHPERAIMLAVKRMLPIGTLGRKMLTKLKVYSGGEHPHQAQNPQPLDLK